MRNFKRRIIAVAAAMALTVLASSVAMAAATNRLTVMNSSGATSVFNVDDAGLASTSKMLIGATTFNDANGKLGISSGTFNVFELSAHNNSAQSSSYLTLFSGGTEAAPTIAAANSIIGAFIFRAHDGTGYKNSSMIRAGVDGTPAAGSMPGYMTFSTAATGTATLSERMRITNAGFVGIGTNAPKSKLHVVGLPQYANNAAAITGGLTAGAFYRTGADPDLVCVVH